MDSYEKIKADLPQCGLKGCNRIGIIECHIEPRLNTSDSTHRLISKFDLAHFCCKTHMLRFYSKMKLPRYSKKAVQRLVGTMEIKFDQGAGI